VAIVMRMIVVMMIVVMRVMGVRMGMSVRATMSM